MLILIGLLIFGLFLASLILPWTQLHRLRNLQKGIKRLNDQVTWLIAYVREKGEKTPEEWEKISRPSYRPVPEKQKTDKAPEKAPALTSSTAAIKASPEKVAEPSVKKQFQFKDMKKAFEQKFFVNLPVWVGGIALALADAFLVKYSIEMGFLSPSVRLVIGGLFGITLLLSGNWINDRPNIANGTRISQALSGAGIADLYVCLFAATSFYHLMPPILGFVGMAGVTTVAVVLSLKQGPPIAILGMIGGFLTPALIESSERNAPLLFIYLYFVLVGLFTVIRQKNWWFISIPVVLAAFSWVTFWLATAYSPNDSTWLGLFLIAVSGTIVFYSKQAMENTPNHLKTFQPSTISQWGELSC